MKLVYMCNGRVQGRYFYELIFIKADKISISSFIKKNDFKDSISFQQFKQGETVWLKNKTFNIL